MLFVGSDPIESRHTIGCRHDDSSHNLSKSKITPENHKLSVKHQKSIRMSEVDMTTGESLTTRGASEQSVLNTKADVTKQIAKAFQGYDGEWIHNNRYGYMCAHSLIYKTTRHHNAVKVMPGRVPRCSEIHNTGVVT